MKSNPTRTKPKLPIPINSNFAYKSPDFDWSDWELSWEDDVGQGTFQAQWILYFHQVLKQWAVERQCFDDVHIGIDAFFQLNDEGPNRQISPDVYLLRRSIRPPMPLSFAYLADASNVPAIAFECVSEDWRSDYVTKPQKYECLRVPEFVIFDPAYAHTRVLPNLAPQPLARTAISVYRPDETGAYHLVEQGNGPFWSTELEAWLCIVNHRNTSCLGLARDRLAEDIILPWGETESQRADEQEKRADETGEARGRTGEACEGS